MSEAIAVCRRGIFAADPISAWTTTDHTDPGTYLPS